MKLNLKKQRKGFTLVELLLVVGIIALGAVVAYITLPKVQSTARANSEATNINTIAAGIKNIYAGTTSYNPTGSAPLTNAVLISAKAMPDRMVQSDKATVLNGFGGTVVVSASNMGSSAANTAYAITYNAVPQAECTKLATGVGNNFSQMSIGTTFIRMFPSTTAIDPSAVAIACAAGADNNVMVFYNQ